MANEKRLIDAKDVKELINGLSELPWKEEVDYLVDSLSTVDAVEVVRCKDCKYKSKEMHTCRNVMVRGEILDIWIEPDDFCSYGERKDNGKE